MCGKASLFREQVVRFQRLCRRRFIPQDRRRSHPELEIIPNGKAELFRTSTGGAHFKKPFFRQPENVQQNKPYETTTLLLLMASKQQVRTKTRLIHKGEIEK